MKWEIDTAETKLEKLRMWHAHYCWLPHKMIFDNSDKITYVWMDRVLRRAAYGELCGNKIVKIRWEYKASEFDLMKEIK